jgi:transposase InsO family protein
MPWKECTAMDLREELMKLAEQPGSNFSRLCERYGVSSKTGYKWRDRYRAGGVAELADRSRRPQHSPRRSEPELEQQVLAIRDEYGWGARKIKAVLEREGKGPVAKSTVHNILQRHERIESSPDRVPGAYRRFERAGPNELWQMDFKGHFPLGNNERCYPLTVLDDHSRFSLCLQACRNEQRVTVQAQLEATFRRYGLPERMLMDNGAPWRSDHEHQHTRFTVWLLRLGIAVSHGRPYHPQTQGKEERFHRTLKAEVLSQRVFADWERIQTRFDEWRHCYNQVRPHEALDMAVPASRYRESPRAFPEALPAFEYDSTDQVRKVQADGKIFFRNREYRVGKAFRGYPVAVRATTDDGVYQVFFATHRIAQVDLRDPVRREES